MKKITVINIRAASYVGTTWVNLMLGSHPRVFSLGNLEKALNRLEEKPNVSCRVHFKNCPFWSYFADKYDPAKNIFLQLAEASGKDVFVITNPRRQEARQQLSHPLIKNLNYRLIRDARAMAASYLRKNSGKDILQVISQWLYRAVHVYNYRHVDKKARILRYEDIVAAPVEFLRGIGESAGIEYDADALRYWEHEHHIVVGNQRTIGVIRHFQGLGESDLCSEAVYGDFIREIQKTGGAKFEDKRWTAELSRRDRYFIDFFCGEENARRGYVRDTFSAEEQEEYGKELAAVREAGTFNEKAMTDFEKDPLVPDRTLLEKLFGRLKGVFRMDVQDKTDEMIRR